MSEVIGYVTINCRQYQIVSEDGRVKIVGFNPTHREWGAVMSRLKALLKG